MSYLDEARLSAYDSSLKEWVSSQNSKTITSSIYPWTKTAKAGAVSCYPVGGTNLKPVVDFLFTEVPPASGDKGPENPSTISGVSSVNVGHIGKNLLLQAAGTSNGYTISRNNDGSLSVSGSGAVLLAVTDCDSTVAGSVSSYRLNLNKQYTLSVELVSGSFSNALINIAQSTATQRLVSVPASGKASTTFTPSVAGYINGRFICRILTGSDSVATNAVLKIQLEEGDIATDFEAPMLPAEAIATISLGGTYYGGNIDLNAGTMTVTVVKTTFSNPVILVSNQTDETYISAQMYLDPYKHGSNADTNLSCNKFPAGTGLTGECLYLRGGSGHDAVALKILKSRLDVSGAVDPQNPTDAEWLASFKSWVTNNVIEFTYTSYIPQTIQLTPTQILSLTQIDKYTPRLNTVYTDASSVQVGYVKSPIYEEYELTQAIVAQGGNV